MARSPETANSRPTIRITIQAGTARTCTRAISAEDISSLSAIGSSSVPMVVIWRQRRARYPSSRSVLAAHRKIAQSQPDVGDGGAAKMQRDILLNQCGDQQGHEENPQDRQQVRDIHRSSQL